MMMDYSFTPTSPVKVYYWDSEPVPAEDQEPGSIIVAPHLLLIGDTND